MTTPAQLDGARRRESHAVLVRLDLFDDADLHRGAAKDT
jgi:hypothetical protein